MDSVVGRLTRGSQWRDLDDTLVLLQELHPIDVKVTWYDGINKGVERKQIERLLEHLLPEAVKKPAFKLDDVRRQFYQRRNLEWFNQQDLGFNNLA